MSSSKHEFLCIMPDKPNMEKRRLQVRPAHLANLRPLIESGAIVAGGVMFAQHYPVEGETPNIAGSSIFVMAESADEAREILSGDIYATEGVWDMEKIQVIPFKSALRVPLAANQSGLGWLEYI